MSFSKTFLRRINSPTVNIYIGKKWEKRHCVLCHEKVDIILRNPNTFSYSSLKLLYIFS